MAVAAGVLAREGGTVAELAAALGVSVVDVWALIDGSNIDTGEIFVGDTGLLLTVDAVGWIADAVDALA